MSSDPLARLDIWAGPPNDSEYDAVYAAVTATERGRWFLTEFANRNRHADTGLLVAAIARIESAVHADAAPQSPDWPQTEDTTVAIIEAAPEAINDNADGVQNSSDGDELSLSRLFGSELQADEKTTDAVVPLADEMTSVPVATEEPLELPSRSMGAIMPPADFEEVHAPPRQARVDDVPRWIIEPPDFVFSPADRTAAKTSAETGAEIVVVSAPAQLQMQGLQPPGPEDDPAELFESPARPAAITPVLTSAPADHAPSPPLRVANGATRNTSRAAPVDALAAIRRLSEDELIALFG